MSDHTCHARHCDEPCKPEHLMCPRHWRMVPDRVQRRARSVRRRPTSDEWFEAANDAIKAVAEKEETRCRYNLDDGSLFAGVKYGLTIWWPWSTAIIHSHKRVENRTWRPWDRIIGKRIAIHCGKTKDDSAIEQIMAVPDIEWLPEDGPAFDDVKGCIIGTAKVLGYIDEDGGCAELVGEPSGWVSRDGETLQDAIRKSLFVNLWWGGPVGWILDEAHPIDDPIPARGQSGLWNVQKQIRAAIARCDRCGRPDGQTVPELPSGAWSDGEQWYDSQGLEVDLVPRGQTVSESEAQLDTCQVEGEERTLCGPCRDFYSIGSEVDADGQGLLV